MNSQVSKQSNIVSNLQWLLPGVIVIVVLLAFLSNFKGTISKFRQGDPSTLTLALIVSLCSAYAIERYVYSTQAQKQFDCIQERFDSLDDSLRKTIEGRFLDEEEMYKVVASACRTATRHIRILLLESRPRTPEWVTTVIAERLKEARVQYDAVFVVDTRNSAPDPEVIKSEDYGKIFSEHDVLNQCSLWVIEATNVVTFDVLIVDDQLVGIGLTRSKQGQDLECGMLLNNHQLALELIDWFDNIVLPKAKRYDTWLEEI